MSFPAIAIPARIPGCMVRKRGGMVIGPDGCGFDMRSPSEMEADDARRALRFGLIIAQREGFASPFSVKISDGCGTFPGRFGASGAKKNAARRAAFPERINPS